MGLFFAYIFPCEFGEADSEPPSEPAVTPEPVVHEGYQVTFAFYFDVGTGVGQALQGAIDDWDQWYGAMVVEEIGQTAPLESFVLAGYDEEMPEVLIAWADDETVIEYASRLEFIGALYDPEYPMQAIIVATLGDVEWWLLDELRWVFNDYFGSDVGMEAISVYAPGHEWLSEWTFVEGLQ